MARFQYDPNRVNYTVQQQGREYQLRLAQRSQAIFTALLEMLPSNYVSAIQGPSYTQELKAVAVELSRIELALEDVSWDNNFGALQGQQSTRSDFLYSIIGYLVFVNGNLPPLTFSDVEFKNFLLSLIAIYFQGSVPKSMGDVASLLITGNVVVTESFLLVRQGATGLDISDEFTFSVDVTAPAGGGFPPNAMNVDAALRMLLDIVRPAHTLFKIRYIFSDNYFPNGTGQILDAMRSSLGAYYYDDFRSYWPGIRNRDRLGRKQNHSIVGEQHGPDF
jgi:hypothetical protein